MGIRVLIVDDHPIVREGVRRILERERDMEVCGEATNREEVLTMTAECRPDIVLLDMRMPGLGGIETISRLCQRFPQLKVVCLTLYGGQYLAQAIAAGASGYIIKEARSEDLLSALRSVNRNHTFTHASLLGKRPDQSASLARRGQGSILSQREIDIMLLMALGATTKEIAGRLYLSDSTVKREIEAILDKLNARNRAEAISLAYQKGLMQSLISKGANAPNTDSGR